VTLVSTELAITEERATSKRESCGSRSLLGDDLYGDLFKISGGQLDKLSEATVDKIKIKTASVSK